MYNKKLIWVINQWLIEHDTHPDAANVRESLVKCETQMKAIEDWQRTLKAG